jgi:hypothetical protein
VLAGEDRAAQHLRAWQQTGGMADGRQCRHSQGRTDDSLVTRLRTQFEPPTTASSNWRGRLTELPAGDDFRSLAEIMRRRLGRTHRPRSPRGLFIGWGVLSYVACMCVNISNRHLRATEPCAPYMYTYIMQWW